MRRRRVQRDKRNGNYFVWIRRSGASRYFRLGSNKRQAEKDLEEVERDIESGRISFVEQETSQVLNGDGTKDIRIEELAHRHLEWVKANRSQATFSIRQHYVCRFLKFVGECMVSSLDLSKIEGFRTRIAGQRERTSNGNGGNEALRHVKTMLRWAEEYDLCAMPVRKFPKIRASPPETRHFTPQEISAILAAAPADFRDILFFGMATGLRPQELRQLTRGDLSRSPDGGYCIRIERHKTARQAAEPRPRSVPLSAEAVEAIRRQLDDSRGDSECVFLNGDGTPYTAHVFRRRLKRLCKKIGMGKPKPPYGLRHTFGTMEAASGINQSVLAQLMGHTRLQTTDRYVANVDEAHRKAMNLLGKELGGLLPKDVQDGPEKEAPGDKTRSKVATGVATDENGGRAA